MINDQESYNKALIKHLKKLRVIAENAQPKDLLKKIARYYHGRFDKQKDKVQNHFNIIKNIIETKTTLILDSKIATTIVPATHSMETFQNMAIADKLAMVMNDCIKDVFKYNQIERIKTRVSRDTCKKIGITELSVEQDQKTPMQVNICINNISFENFFPDPSCKDIQEGNYHFIKSMKSLIELKSKYPQYADKFEKLAEQSSKDYKDRPTGVVTSTVQGNTAQSFTYSDPGNILKAAVDVPVWKCYLKDDSTFDAEENTSHNDSQKEDLEELKAKYPNGRLITFCGDELVLEDEAIPYKFGYPLDICYDIEGDKIWDAVGECEDLFEIQDRLNRAMDKAREMIGKAGSWLLFDPRSGLQVGDFVNKTVLPIENMGGSGNKPEILTNNTLDKFNMLTDYIDKLKRMAYEVARLNPEIVAGQSDTLIQSGEQVKALQESPMAGIRYLQRNYKDWYIGMTKKIAIMIQTHYTTPRIIRIATGDKMVKIPTAGSSNPIEIYKKQQQPNAQGQPEDVYSCIDTIHGDLTMIDYDVDVIAGSERPRSRSENGQMMLTMYNMGMLGNDLEAKAQLIEELDIPNSKMITDRLQKEQDAAAKMPAIDITNPETLEKFGNAIKNLNGFTAAIGELLQKAGLSPTRDGLVDAPIQQITSKAEVGQVQELRAAMGEVPQNVPVEQIKKQTQPTNQG